MKEQTAMKELISFIKMNPDSLSQDDILREAKALVKVEKKQIVDAVHQGVELMNGDWHMGEISEGEQYYKDTYK